MTASHRFEGGCHCGNLAYVFEASADLQTLGLRACQCRFCRAHGARNTSDPKGTMRLIVRDPKSLLRYRFGLGTADFLICGGCGVYIGAMVSDAQGAWMTVNANTFYPLPPSDFPIVPHVYEAEDASSRIARRKEKWTPVIEFKELP